ncbi:hypothetical protein Tco_1122882 [Tanacetum coccineum]|uniref:Uncharacterized protein n=1 Tax=Tanacetum coccineum TaxID=301880 RepID=A0ABQ5J4L2_9ASTR
MAGYRSCIYLCGKKEIKAFQDKVRNVDVVCNLIKDTVRLRVLSLSLKDFAQVCDAAKIWEFHVVRSGGKKKVSFYDGRSKCDLTFFISKTCAGYVSRISQIGKILEEQMAQQDTYLFLIKVLEGYLSLAPKEARLSGTQTGKISDLEKSIYAWILQLSRNMLNMTGENHLRRAKKFMKICNPVDTPDFTFTMVG